MVHFLQYFNGRASTPTALAAWSFKRNSGYKDVKTYLYTPRIENLDNPLLQKVFDEIRPPSWETEQLKYLDWSLRYAGGVNKWASNIYQFKTRYYKLFSFLYHPCEDAEAVIHFDWDTITVKNITEDIDTDNYIFGCVVHPTISYSEGNIWYSASGMYKTPKFDHSQELEEISSIVFDIEKCSKADKCLPGSTDDAVVTYFAKEHSHNIKKLTAPYFESTFSVYQDMQGKVLHWAGSKPWNSNCVFNDVWFRYAKCMLDELELDDSFLKVYTDEDLDTNTNSFKLSNLSLGLL